MLHTRPAGSIHPRWASVDCQYEVAAPASTARVVLCLVLLWAQVLWVVPWVLVLLLLSLALQSKMENPSTRHVHTGIQQMRASCRHCKRSGYSVECPNTGLLPPHSCTPLSTYLCKTRRHCHTQQKFQVVLLLASSVFASVQLSPQEWVLVWVQMSFRAQVQGKVPKSALCIEASGTRLVIALHTKPCMRDHCTTGLRRNQCFAHKPLQVPGLRGGSELVPRLWEGLSLQLMWTAVLMALPWLVPRRRFPLVAGLWQVVHFLVVP